MPILQIKKLRYKESGVMGLRSQSWVAVESDVTRQFPRTCEAVCKLYAPYHTDHVPRRAPHHHQSST